MEKETQQQIVNALENIQDALEHPSTQLAESLDIIGGVLYEIRDALIQIANKD